MVRRPKDRDIVCCVCKKRMVIGHGLTSVLKDYSQCAECLEKEYVISYNRGIQDER